MLAVIYVGSGDGSVTVDLDGYGSFGRLQSGSARGDAIIDRIGPLGETGLIYESATAIGAGGNRGFLTDGFIGTSDLPRELILPDISSSISISADNSTATSSFALSDITGSLASLNGLSVTLTQELTAVLENEVQAGALLTQTYVMSNTTAATMDFDLIRYVDVDVNRNTGDNDGGGRVFIGGREWLVTTASDAITDLSQSDTFVAISTEGGVEPSTGRFEVEPYPSGGLLISNTILPGNELDDLVFNDSNDPDELIDIETYDTTGALRTDYIIAPGKTAAFVTYTLFGDGVVEDLIDTAPKVTEVVISNSSTGEERSYFELVNELDEFTGDQIRELQFLGADTVTITFSEPVVVTGNELKARSIRRGDTYPLLFPTNNGGPNNDTYTWKLHPGETFESPDHILLALDDTITDGQTYQEGNLLDGEWVNPISVTTTDNAELISEFPSGNGIAGGEFRFVFTTYLLGDFNNDDQYTQADLDLVILNWGEDKFPIPDGWVGLFADNGSSIIGQSEYDAVLLNWGANYFQLFFYGDWDNNGSVGQGDLDPVLLGWGQAESSNAAFLDEVWSDPDDMVGQWELDGVILNWGHWFSTNVNPNADPNLPG